MSRLRSSLRRFLFRVAEWSNRKASRFTPGPFLDEAEFPWVSVVEAHAGEIQRELAEVQARESIPNFQDISEDQHALTTDDRWKTFFLYGYGYRDIENCKRCPKTDEALQMIPGMMTAMFSILAPGKEIPPHRGPYNGVLRYHLALKIPDDGETSGIRVGDQVRHWRVGRSLVFDDTYDHEAWNRSSEERVVLFVDFERPTWFPVNLANRFALWAIRRTRFVQQAVDNLARHREKTG